MTNEHDQGDYILVHKTKAKISRTRRGVIGLMAVGAIAAIAGGGTFASFSASTTNDATFNTGTLILSNQVDSGETCFSSRTGVDVDESTPAANDANLDANDTECDNLMSTALTPGDPLDAHVTLRNEGNTNGTLNVFRSEACVDGAFTGTSEIQRIDIDATDGTFTVSDGTETSAALDHDVSLANLQTALEGLDEIGAGNVLVTGTVGTTYTLTFQGDLATSNVDPVVVEDALLDNGGGAGTGTGTLTTVRNGAGTTIAGSKVTDLCGRIRVQIQEVQSVGGAVVASGDCVLPVDTEDCGTNMVTLDAIPEFAAAVSAGTLNQGEERFYRIRVEMDQTTGTADCTTSLGGSPVDVDTDGFEDTTGQGCDNPYMNGQAATAIRWQLQLS